MRKVTETFICDGCGVCLPCPDAYLDTNYYLFGHKLELKLSWLGNDVHICTKCKTEALRSLAMKWGAEEALKDG